MTDFKVGDRVRVVRCSQERSAHESREGTVLRNKGWCVEVDIPGASACEATMVESVEPYEPRDGDEITISMRGKVAPAMYGDWNFTTADFNNHTFSDFGGYEVTVHERGPEPKPKLPTTPGSVFRSLSSADRAHGDGIRVIVKDGVLRPTDGKKYSRDIYGRFEVIYDAGLRAEGSESFPTSGRDGAK